jgi:hypothetical protein
MNENGKLDRRAFLERAMMIGLAAGAASVAAACDGGGSKPAGGGAAAPKKKAGGACTDVSGLTEAELKTREQLAYVDVSKVQGKNCKNCGLFQAKKPCNGCTVVKGPIAENGYCTAWAPKA